MPEALKITTARRATTIRGLPFFRTGFKEGNLSQEEAVDVTLGAVTMNDSSIYG
jgi:hypothetical protein